MADVQNDIKIYNEIFDDYPIFKKFLNENNDISIAKMVQFFEDFQSGRVLEECSNKEFYEAVKFFQIIAEVNLLKNPENQEMQDFKKDIEELLFSLENDGCKAEHINEKILEACAENKVDLDFIIEKVKDIYFINDIQAIKETTIAVLKKLIENEFISVGELNNNEFVSWNFIMEKLMKKIEYNLDNLHTSMKSPETVFFQITEKGLIELATLIDDDDDDDDKNED
jgi:hypothetical protein